MGLGAKAKVFSVFYKVLRSSVHHPCAVTSSDSLPLLLHSKNPSLGAKAKVLSVFYKVLRSSVHHPCAVTSYDSLPLLLHSKNPSLFAFPHKNVRLAPAPWTLHLLLLRT